jgi:Spy/CpxP family protein refolding chaperone
MNELSRKLILVVFALLFLSIGAATAASADTRSIDTILAEIRKDQGLAGSDKIDPDKVSPALLEELGDALMDRAIPDKERHEFMDRMMGGEGSASLAAMHERIAYNYLSGNFYGYGGMTGDAYGYGPGGMMGGGYGGMMGRNHGYGTGGKTKNYGGGSAGGNRWMADWIGRFVSLTSGQREKITDVYIALEKDISPLRIQVLEKRRALLGLWSAKGTLDEDAILKAEKELDDILARIDERETRARIDTFKILSPEQRSKLSNIGHMWGYDGKDDLRNSEEGKSK